MDIARYQIDGTALARYAELREDAIRYALNASERAFSKLPAHLRERGREAGAEEIGFLLDYLRATLETHDIALFMGYAAWHFQVQTSRGLPPKSVIDSLDDLASFFSDRMGSHGSSIAAILAAAKDALVAGIAVPGYDKPCPDRWEQAEPFATAALLGKRNDATSLLDEALASGNSLPRTAVHVIQPALYDVGRLWQQNRVSVAQEHFATAMSQTWLARSMARAKAAPDNGKRALFACVPGNQHVVGLRIVADAFELDGWSSTYLDANTPLAALVERVRGTRPHLVGFSASMPQQLRSLRTTVSGLREALRDDAPRVVVGGLVFAQFPQLARWVGAEVLGTDAVTAAAAAAAAA